MHMLDADLHHCGLRCIANPPPPPKKKHPQKTGQEKTPSFCISGLSDPSTQHFDVFHNNLRTI